MKVTITKKLGNKITVGYYNDPTEHLYLSTPDAEIYLWPEDFREVLSFIETIPVPNGFRREQ